MAALTLPLFPDEQEPEPLHRDVRAMLDATNKSEAETVLYIIRCQLEAGQEKLGKSVKPKNVTWDRADIGKVTANVKKLRNQAPLLVDVMLDAIQAWVDTRRIYDQKIGDWYFEEFTRLHKPGTSADHVAEIAVDRPHVQIEPGQRISWMQGKRRMVGVVEKYDNFSVKDDRFPPGHIEHTKNPACVLVLTDLGYHVKAPVSRTDPYLYTQLYLVYGGEQPPVNHQKPVEAKLALDPDWSKRSDKQLIAQIIGDLIIAEAPYDVTKGWNMYLRMRGDEPTLTPTEFNELLFSDILPDEQRHYVRAYFQPTHEIIKDGLPIRIVERCHGGLEWISARDGVAVVGWANEDLYSQLRPLE